MEEKGTLCEGCYKLHENTKKCAVCLVSRYCSKECQKIDWRRHKRACDSLKECGENHPIVKKLYKADPHVILETAVKLFRGKIPRVSNVATVTLSEEFINAIANGKSLPESLDHISLLNMPFAVNNIGTNDFVLTLVCGPVIRVLGMVSTEEYHQLAAKYKKNV